MKSLREIGLFLSVSIAVFVCVCSGAFAGETTTRSSTARSTSNELIDFEAVVPSVTVGPGVTFQRSSRVYHSGQYAGMVSIQVEAEEEPRRRPPHLSKFVRFEIAPAPAGAKYLEFWLKAPAGVGFATEALEGEDKRWVLQVIDGNNGQWTRYCYPLFEENWVFPAGERFSKARTGEERIDPTRVSSIELNFLIHGSTAEQIAYVDDIRFSAEGPLERAGKTDKVQVAVDCAAAAGPLNALWLDMSAGWNLSKEENLRAHSRVVKELPVRFWRLHSYDEQREAWKGPGEYDWHEFDRIFKDLLEPTDAVGMFTIQMVPDYLWAEDTAQKEQPYLYPPGDYEGWGRLIEDTVHHCTDAGLNFEYYEIWNEPLAKNFWKGTFAEYLELYAHTSRAVKRADPSVKVGGPAFIWGAEQLIRYCHDNHLPLDFLSYHLYSPWPEVYGRITGLMRCLLDRFPEFKNTELVFNEWSYDWLETAKVPQYSNSSFKAAHCAETLYHMLETGVDKGGYWRPGGDTSTTGLFAEDGAPKPAYNAFRLFSMLREDRIRTSVVPADTGIRALGSRSKDEIAVLLWWYLPEPYNLKRTQPISVAIESIPFTGQYTYEHYVVDSRHSNYHAGRDRAELERVAYGQAQGEKFVLDLPDLEAFSVHLVRIVQDEKE